MPWMRRTLPATLLLVLSVGVGCDGPEEGEVEHGDGACQSWLGARSLGQVDTGTLDEVSGIAASRRFVDVAWVHNDGDNTAAVSAVGAQAERLGTWTLLGAENRDWEDLAAGPCGDGASDCSCLYLGDIGDNNLSRDSAVLYRFVEPDDLDGSGGQVTGLDELWFDYPDGPHDAESVAVHPLTGQVLVITKAGVDGMTGVFAFPDTPPALSTEADPAELVELGWIDLDAVNADDAQVTAADFSPRGLRLALRTDEDLLLYDLSGGESLAEALEVGPTFAPAPEEDGEAVTFSPDGRALLLVGEGTRPTLWEVRCNAFSSDGSDDPDPLVECGG